MAVSRVASQSLWTRGVAAAILRDMDAYRREVGIRLKLLREAQNWSQEDAAHAVGVTSSTWGRWERGQRGPYDQNWKRIARAFGDAEAREARGRPPAPLGLSSNGDGAAVIDRLQELETLVSGLDERLRLFQAEAATRDAEALKQIEQGFETIQASLRGRRQ